MKESIDLSEVTKSLNNIKILTEKISNNLGCIDNLIMDNINNGKGILDGNSGEQFIKRWESLKEEIPQTIELLNKQETNLELFINSMKREDE